MLRGFDVVGKSASGLDVVGAAPLAVPAAAAVAPATLDDFTANLKQSVAKMAPGSQLMSDPAANRYGVGEALNGGFRLTSLDEVKALLSQCLLNPNLADPASDPSHDILRKYLNKTAPDLAWFYILDGCYARGDVSARVAQDAQTLVNAGKTPMAVCKLWVKGTLRASNVLYTANWGYHIVNAFLCVDNSTGKPQFMVVSPDPALSGVEPGQPLQPMILSPEQWVEKINPSNQPVQIYMTAPIQFWPPWSSPPPASLAASLTQAQSINANYYQQQVQAEQNYAHGHGPTPPAPFQAIPGEVHDAAEGLIKVHDPATGNELPRLVQASSVAEMNEFTSHKTVRNITTNHEGVLTRY
jgi:hypothetical protein